MYAHSSTTIRRDDPPTEPPVDDGPEDNWGGWRKPISWSDGPPERAGDDNCAFAAARLVAVGACVALVALKLAGSVWSGRRPYDDPPIIDDDPHDGDPPAPPIYY